MTVAENVSLKPFNTFHIDANTRYFSSIQSTADFRVLMHTEVFKKSPRLVLGGGSNILFSGDFDGLIIKNEIAGIDLIKETQDHVWIKTGSGENWHDFVITCLKNKWYGLENLSLIPGSVGAAPVQNIGAYGVELQDLFEHLTAVDLETGNSIDFEAGDCQFGYRQSVFKGKFRQRLLITSVTLKLNKHPRVNLSYRALSDYFSGRDSANISPEEVSQAVIDIRQSKLPDPKTIGNGGSFFKNPVISAKEFEALHQQYTTLPYFAESAGDVKIPAGWLIEQCGWKGKRAGNAGVHHKQALVLVNHGSATGPEIVNLAREIEKSVYDKFQIKLEPEVNII